MNPQTLRVRRRPPPRPAARLRRRTDRRTQRHSATALVQRKGMTLAAEVIPGDCHPRRRVSRRRCPDSPSTCSGATHRNDCTPRSTPPSVGGGGALPQLTGVIGLAGMTLLGLGGVLYTMGVVIHAVRRPDPVPAAFGYHEVFHTLVIAAAALPVRGHRLLDHPRVRTRYAPAGIPWTSPPA